MQFRKTYLELSKDNLRHNLRLFRTFCGQEFFCPMVKANAYGHGDVEATKICFEEGADAVGVVTLEEGIQLRRHFSDETILVFGIFDESSVATVEEYSLTPVIGSEQTFTYFRDNFSGPFHLMINTGMNRLGLSVEQAQVILENPPENLRGIATHFFHGEDWLEPNSTSKNQYSRFLPLMQRAQEKQITVHIFNSASAILSATEHSTIPCGARIGISLYGLWPFKTKKELAFKLMRRFPLKPVMTLKSQVAKIQQVKKGQSVSYGAKWVAPEDTTIAVVALGYADGYFRALGNRASMTICERRVPVVGAVCMDYTMVDIGELIEQKIEVAEGDEVIVFSDNIAQGETADTLAERLETISYEIVTRISYRVPRVWK